VHRRGEGGGRLGGEPGLHEVHDGVLAEGRRAQHGGQRIAGQLGQDVVIGAGLLGAQPDGEQGGEPLQPPREVGHEAQRRRVAAVQVVDDEQQRPALGEVGRQPEQAVQDREGGLGGRRPVGRRGVEERRGERGGARQQLVLRAAARRQHGGLEQLAHHAVGELVLEL
jgi:hypothetical protein